MIQTTKDIVEVIEQDKIEITSQMLKHLIQEHREGDGKKRRKLWDRYELEDADIFHREPANYEKVDRKVANDFYADIVDTKTGYMGNEVTVSLNKEEFKTDDILNEEEYDDRRKWLRMFALQNSAEDQNSELVRGAAALGVTYRLLYVDDEANVKMKQLQPWEVIYIYDRSIDDPQVAIRFYTIEVHNFGGRGKDEELTAVEWYDNDNIIYYIDDGKLNFSVDTSRGVGGVEPHLFSRVPIIPFPNNQQLRGEGEKVITLIDAYDAIMSSTTSEIEQLRMAYMFVKSMGLAIDDDFVKALEQTGIFPLDEQGEVGFINKQLADAPVHNLLKEIRRNIYQFAKSIDMSKDFGGEMRVIGWQVALLNLENSSKITERKFTRAFRYQYDLLTDYWRRVKGIDLDPLALEFIFTRNFPRDLKAEAETLSMLLGNISTKTAFELMSFIDDPEEEMAQIENEQGPYRSIDDEPRPDEDLPEDTEES